MSYMVDDAKAPSVAAVTKCTGIDPQAFPDASAFFIIITTHFNLLLPLLILTGLMYAAIVVLSAKFLRDAKDLDDEQIRSDVYQCLSTPLVLSSICILGMVVPRATAGLSTISIAYVMFALWRSVSLLFRMYGDVGNMSRLMYQSDTQLPLHSIPLCCCPCLPSIEPSVANISYLKFFVLQTPLVRMAIVVAQNVLKVEGYCSTNLFTQLLSYGGVISTLIAVYSSQIFVKMSTAHIVQYRLDTLILCTNLTQALYNILRAIIDSFLTYGIFFGDIVFSDGKILPAGVQADYWYSFLLTAFLLSICFALARNIRPGRSALFDIRPSPFALDPRKVPIIEARTQSYRSTDRANEESTLV